MDEKLMAKYGQLKLQEKIIAGQIAQIEQQIAQEMQKPPEPKVEK